MNISTTFVMIKISQSMPMSKDITLYTLNIQIVIAVIPQRATLKYNIHVYVHVAIHIYK